jgi:hypothetical protein
VVVLVELQKLATLLLLPQMAVLAVALNIITHQTETPPLELLHSPLLLQTESTLILVLVLEIMVAATFQLRAVAVAVAVALEQQLRMVVRMVELENS